MNQKIIKTDFHFTDEELKDFFRFHLTTKDNTRFFYYLSSLVSAIIGVVLVFVFEKTFGFILLIIAVLLLLMYPIQIKRVVNKIVASRFKHKKQSLIFTDDMITQEGETKKIYQWQQILEVIETKNYLYLYITKNSALIVNKITLSESKYNDLIVLIKDHTKQITKYKYK